MSIVTRMKSVLRMEHRDSDYGQDVIEALFNVAQTGPVDPIHTASVETAVRALSGPYGVAMVTGPSLITPAFLMDLARRLFTSGNAVYRIDMADDALDLVPAANFDVSGTARRWVYELDTPVPGNSKVDRRRVPADGVVHVQDQYAQPVGALAGSGTLARLPAPAAKTLSMIERSLGMDASPPGGVIMPQPDGISATAMAQIKSALSNGKGAVNLVETTNQGFGQGITAAPKEDWLQKRFGAIVPEQSISLRKSMAEGIMQAFGVPPAIFTGDGNAMREARRLMFLDSILPTSALIEAELTTKLETPISISHNESEYADSQRLGRFLKSLTDAGYSLPDAANIVGLPRAE